MSKKRSFLILGAVLLLFVLCVVCLSCGGLALWSARSKLSGSGSPRPSSLPGQGKTLRLFEGEPAILDPALVQDSTSAAYVVEIFSGLVTLDEHLKVVPDIAERWEISQDGTVYTFHLREGVQFQDGKPVTARDFQFSLERACSPQLRSPVAASYLGDILGVREVIQGRAQQIVGLRVIDDRTLEITIDGPKSYFLSKLTYSTAFVVDGDNVGQRDWAKRPNGTGPFKLAKWEDDQIELVRNDRFYRGPAHLERVQFQLSGGVPMTMYENGELDIVQVGLTDIERVQDPTNPLHRELVVVPNLNVQYVAFSVRVPPFDDLKVRQAFVHATDRQKLAELVMKGMVIPARGILPPELPGYNDKLVGLEYNLPLAKQMIASSRYGQGGLPPITLHISGEAMGLPRSVEALLAIWKENLGVEVSVETTAWPEFLQDVNERRYPLYFLGWMADYPDPHNFLDLLFHSESDENHMGYANPEVDRLLVQARVEQDAGRRLQLYQQVEEILVRDAVWIPLWHDRDYFLIKPYVKGVHKAPTIVPWLKDVYIETD